jgi:hypothetical protein
VYYFRSLSKHIVFVSLPFMPLQISECSFLIFVLISFFTNLIVSYFRLFYLYNHLFGNEPTSIACFLRGLSLSSFLRHSPKVLLLQSLLLLNPICLSKYCTVFGVVNLTMSLLTTNCGVYKFVTTSRHQMYNVRSLMTALDLLLARLQMTPFDLLHWFIYDSTSRDYSLSSYNEF